jgi:hypothetical protein
LIFGGQAVLRTVIAEEKAGECDRYCPWRPARGVAI